MSAIESILEAYCVELDEVINIEEAHDAFFSQNEPRKRFNFLCSDEQCRLLDIPPKITGVNYSSEFFENAPHFRRNQKDIHSEECIWGKYNKILHEMLANKKKYKEKSNKNIFKEFAGDIDSADVFDEFYIPDKNKKIYKNECCVKNNNASKSRENIERFILNYSKRTCRLQSLVDIFRKMCPDDRKTAEILLPGNPLISYKKAFKFVADARHYFYWTHIYYGEVKIYHYSKNEQGYRLFFRNAQCKYNDDNIEFDVTAFIHDEELKKMKHNRSLIEYLKNYSKSKEAVCCYILGKAHLHKADSGGGYNKDSVVIDQASSRFIVFRETSPHCE